LEDIDKLEELCNYIKAGSLCGLGQTAPNPVLSTLRYFRDEYIAHVVDKKCPAHVCKNLMQYKIDPSKCVGCKMCAKGCPADAIRVNEAGDVKEGKKLPYLVIDPKACVKCGACIATCKFKAIYKD
ncbi:MAG: 4Fe-4S binding protein, partial [Clostridia bacterium]|nr:4Fe-4S binding protein [Clostridia bacterium]